MPAYAAGLSSLAVCQALVDERFSENTNPSEILNHADYKARIEKEMRLVNTNRGGTPGFRRKNSLHKLFDNNVGLDNNTTRYARDIIAGKRKPPVVVFEEDRLQAEEEIANETDTGDKGPPATEGSQLHGSIHDGPKERPTKTSRASTSNAGPLKQASNNIVSVCFAGGSNSTPMITKPSPVVVLPRPAAPAPMVQNGHPNQQPLQQRALPSAAARGPPPPAPAQVEAQLAWMVEVPVGAVPGDKINVAVDGRSVGVITCPVGSQPGHLIPIPNIPAPKGRPSGGPVLPPGTGVLV